MGQRKYTFDYSLLLKDAGLIAATTNAQVGGVDRILDLGTGRIDGTVVIDVTALEADSANEDYQILVQGSSDAAFATDVVVLARLRLGVASVTGETVTSPLGRYEVDVITERVKSVGVNQNYRYMRVRIVVAGTVATGINFTAFLTKDQD